MRFKFLLHSCMPKTTSHCCRIISDELPNNAKESKKIERLGQAGSETAMRIRIRNQRGRSH